MLSIGEFAAVAGLSVKALRHWDERGLLRAAACSPETGYRYYRLDQLAAVDMLERSKDLGLPMTALKSLARGQGLEDLSELPGEAVFRAARTRLSEAKAAIRSVEAYLERVERRHAEERRLSAEKPCIGEKPPRLWHVSEPWQAGRGGLAEDDGLQKLLSDLYLRVKASELPRGADWGLLFGRGRNGFQVRAFLERPADGEQDAPAPAGGPGPVLMAVTPGRFESWLCEPQDGLWREAEKAFRARPGALALACHLCSWRRSAAGGMAWEMEARAS